MNNVDLFETPIKSGKVRKGIYYHKYKNGTININGTKYLCYTISDAVKAWRKANETYLFTDTKTDLTGISIHDPVTWIFSKDNTLLTLKTEMQDVTYNITRVQTIESITGNYTKYSLDNGSAVYVHSETLEVIFCT